MKLNFIVIFIMMITGTACNEKNKNPEKWTDDEISSWFNKKEWLSGWNVLPDASISKRTFAVLYHKNPRHWDQAFHFLKSANLKELPLGIQELEGKHLFVNVQEYYGKAKSEALFESHKKYIDIQYVIEGEEIIGLTSIDKAKVKEQYNEDKDIAFYDSDEMEYRKATPENFFLFFPDDVHQPSITAGDSIQIKKIVVKILIEQ